MFTMLKKVCVGLITNSSNALLQNFQALTCNFTSASTVEDVAVTMTSESQNTCMLFDATSMAFIVFDVHQYVHISTFYLFFILPRAAVKQKRIAGIQTFLPAEKMLLANQNAVFGIICQSFFLEK